MPLILFSGLPSSGKTTKAKELISLLEKHITENPSLKAKGYSIIYHSDETIGIKHEDYITSQDERKLRSEIMSAIKRDLSRNNIVIVDSLNYIKGFRYQLHCEVKNVSTTFCLIHVMCPAETLKEWNSKSENAWDEKLLEQLVQRYEEPDGNTRWDSPLFPILATEDKVEDFFEDICTAVFATSRSADGRDPLGRSFQKPNSVAILKPANQANTLQNLELETSKIVKKIMEHAKLKESIGQSPGGRVIVSENVTDVNDERCAYVDVPMTSISIAQLQRLKRQFINLNKLRSMDSDRIVPLFADYLTKHLDE